MRYASRHMSAEISAGSRVTALRNWYQRPLGRLLAEAELNALAAQLPNLFGYYLIMIDPPWQNCPLEDSRYRTTLYKVWYPLPRPHPD